MIFGGLFLCFTAILLLVMRYWFVFTGHLVEGKIVGYSEGVPDSRYGLVTRRYRIRLKYEEEIYYTESLESATMSRRTIPRDKIGFYVQVYFNPKRPKAVVIKGFQRLNWVAFFLLLLGVLGILASIT